MKSSLWFQYIATIIASMFTVAIIGASGAHAEPFFSDGFESADQSHTENGFRWTNANRVSIVRDDQYKLWGPVAGAMNDGPYEGKQWENAPESGGRHAARFNYPAGVSMSEQRFSLGAAYPELWMSFWLRAPINFSYGPTGSPNKLLAVWMDGYSGAGDGSTIWLGFHRSGDDSATFAFTYSDGRKTGSNAYTGAVPFISVPEDRGRWMQLVIHMKAESSQDADDGFVKVWRRWEGQQSFSQTHSHLNKRIRIPANGPQGFSAGYLLGWANAAYDEDTEFLMDDFMVSTSSLLDVGPPPRPPKSVEAQ